MIPLFLTLIWAAMIVKAFVSGGVESRHALRPSYSTDSDKVSCAGDDVETVMSEHPVAGVATSPLNPFSQAAKV